MAKKRVDDVDAIIDPESEAWNIAKGFTTLKILQPMVALDRYENIAQFGSVEMDDLTSQLPDIAERRVQGLRRFLTTLRQLIGNVQFAIKKGDRELIGKYNNKLDIIEKVLDGVASYEENALTHEKKFVIHEYHFSQCFKFLRRIKDEVNFQLNRAGLIFKESEEVNLDNIMQEIIEGG